MDHDLAIAAARRAITLAGRSIVLALIGLAGSLTSLFYGDAFRAFCGL